jgi:acylphosphatase
MRRVHVVVRGDVQGVGYRYTLRMVARDAGVSGWVRNRRDGSVEAVLQGSPDAIEAVLDACRAGPPASRVARLDIIGESVGAFDGFDVLPTA